MSKNKINWIIAMVLITTFVIPVAHAQGFSMFGYGVANIKFFLVNAAVIFFVLFILQAFLVPGKEGKEKTSMWVIMLIAALLISYLYGQAGYIWQVGPLAPLLDIHILVNTFVISLALYFVSAFIPKLDLKSPEGQTGKILLIIIVGAVIAYNLPHDRFIWNVDNVRGAVSYLLSGEMITRKDGTQVAKGMLHPKGGLFVLVSSFIIIWFFLSNYLLKQGDKNLNLMMAALFAFTMATPPSTALRSVIMMGELFFIFIFWEALKITVGAGKYEKWFALALAMLIVSLISAAVTMNLPEERGFLGSVGCHLPIIGIDCLTSSGTTASGATKTASGGGSLFTFIIEVIIMGAAIAGLFALYKKYFATTPAATTPAAPTPAPAAPATPGGPAPAVPAAPVAPAAPPTP